MKQQLQTLTTTLVLLIVVAGVCIFLLLPGISDAVGIALVGALGCYAVHGQGKRVLVLMDKAKRQSIRICVNLPILRPVLNPAADVIGLPSTTRLFVGVATPPNAPPFICSL